MKLNAHEIIQAPMITEETQIQMGKGNQYTFRVHPKANKNQIRQAVEQIFPNIAVMRVNTMNYQGKRRRQFGSRGIGFKPNWKKAVVTLREGDTIDLI